MKEIIKRDNRNSIQPIFIEFLPRSRLWAQWQEVRGVYRTALWRKNKKTKLTRKQIKINFAQEVFLIF